MDLAEERAAQAVALARVESAAFDELAWRSVELSAETVGLDLAVIDEIIDGNSVELLAQAESDLDSAIAEAGLEGAADVIASARQGEDITDIVSLYGEVLDAVEVDFDAVISELADTAGDAAGNQLADSVEALALAVELRASLLNQFYSFYAAQFQIRGTVEEEIVELIGHRARYAEVTDALRSGAGVPAAVIAELEQLESDPDFVAYTEGLDALVSDALQQNVDSTALEGVSVESTLALFELFTPLLRTIEESSQATSVMLDEATLAVSESIDLLRSQSADQIRRTYALLIALAVVSVAAVVTVTRLIVKPLRSLEASAHQLEEDPGGDVPADLRGPAEVRSAAEALSESAAHIHHATEQADALANGQLDARVLEEQLPGGLGSALQKSVANLRDSLARQEEFRHRLAHEAAHDGLTQLPNRTTTLASLDRGLARAGRLGNKLAVLFVDLDGFKDLNDLHGHHAGDAALAEVAERLVVSVRAGDEVGRLGGDEFLVVADPVSDEAEAVELAERLLEKLARPMSVGGVSFTLGASIGVAVSNSPDATAERVVRDADLALYRAKELGRGTVKVCDDQLRSEVAETSTIATGIRRAIQNEELLLHYQPVVAAGSHEVVALEALVRWRRPTDDVLVPPGEFIGVAERSSLIIDIDLWVLDTVASRIAHWDATDARMRLPVAVNVSARHLASARFVGDVLRALDRHGVSADRLVIEITEGALVDDLPRAAMKLHALREAGVRVSIDDFGTGYTSLSHLRALPFDIIKIDRTFAGHAVERAYEASICKLIIDAGHLLGALVVAEGPETAEDVEALEAMGVDQLQGFYLCSPRAWEQLRDFVEASTSELG